MSWFEEALFSRIIERGYAQKIEIEEVLHREQTQFQDLMIFQSRWFGRVLILDDVVQTTERDEFIYHEMLTHTALFAHGQVKNVLIIGGGDGGILREVLRHPVDQATMVEIDGRVVDLCRDLMPSLSAGAFDDSRAKVIIDDGIRFVAETQDIFDLIIVDSTDPIGPGEVLFTPAFYANCRRCLSPGGIIVTQTGVPFLQPEELTDTYRRRQPFFTDVSAFVISSPTYIGGMMAIGWASGDPGLRTVPLEVLQDRFDRLGLETRYYSPAVHRAAFALPPFIAALLH